MALVLRSVRLPYAFFFKGQISFLINVHMFVRLVLHIKKMNKKFRAEKIMILNFLPTLFHIRNIRNGEM